VSRYNHTGGYITSHVTITLHRNIKYFLIMYNELTLLSQNKYNALRVRNLSYQKYVIQTGKEWMKLTEPEFTADISKSVFKHWEVSKKINRAIKPVLENLKNSLIKHNN
jgi:pyoverdine/dityrosine biosynthesis protein Dit1